MKMSQRKSVEMVPPDGGWGWFIVCALGINNILFIPIMTSFGLIYKDAFLEMGFSATDGSVIMNLNAALSMMSGIINGPLLRIFGYRKIAILGAFLTVLGLILTAFSNTFTTLLISYGIVASIGMGMGMSSYPLALNTYFRKRRSKAMGIGMTITGIGPIIMPQFISILMTEYGVQGCMLILAALTANGFASALLLQPIKWHMVPKITDPEEGDKKKDDTPEENLIKNGDDFNSNTMKKSPSAESLRYDDMNTTYGFETPLSGSVLSLAGRSKRPSISSTYKPVLRKTDENWSSTYSINNSVFGSLQDLPEVDKNDAELQKCLKAEEANKTANLNANTLKLKEQQVYNELSVFKKQKPGIVKRCLLAIIKFFDLTLLKDLIYVNIMLGMSLAVFAELNFSLLTPFILADFDLNNQQIASFLSALSIADIIMRFCAPFIGDYFNKPPRVMYTWTLLLLVITRFSIFLSSGFNSLLVVSIGLGIAKGVRSVYMSLVIASYVPIERLANASGIQMLVNGVFILIGGPILGIIRDVTGNFKYCIIIINAVTLMTITMWISEAVYMKYKKRKAAKLTIKADVNDM